ncbi:MAG: glycoside hydrolase 100 family protein [Cyanophyceae cyanobacterium]
MLPISYSWKAARKALDNSIIYYRGQPVGTIAALDSSLGELNYSHCFVRDFAVSALAFLTEGETEIVRHFLTEVLHLQSRQKRMDCFQAGRGVMPASFKVETLLGTEELTADFGEHAIARVTPVDSVFWWLLILRAYVRATGHLSFAQQPEVQQGIRLILDLCLTTRFDLFPTLFVPDGSFTIDRRMGVDGHPLDIQVLFAVALQTSQEFLLPTPENAVYRQAVRDRLGHLVYHLRQYYWLDRHRLNEIYRYRVEEFGETAVNKFNIYPETIPDWLTDWLREGNGYFVGNLGSGRIDYRFFTQGNLLAVLTAVATEQQSEAIMNTIEHHWSELIADMPMKLCFPALEAQEWQIVTGSDPKNSPWSYHNGGSWPFLLWLLAAAAQKTGRVSLAQQALAIAETRLLEDQWPEYYDGKHGSLIGKQARLFQTWTIAGALAARNFLDNPNHLALINHDRAIAVSSCSLPVK